MMAAASHPLRIVYVSESSSAIGRKQGAPLQNKYPSPKCRTPSMKYYNPMSYKSISRLQTIPNLKRISKTSPKYANPQPEEICSSSGSSECPSDSSTSFKPTTPDTKERLRSKESPAADPARAQIIRSITGFLIGMLDDTVKMPKFDGDEPPSISIHDYVERLVRYVDAWAGEKASSVSAGIRAALWAVEYLERLGAGMSMLAIHRLYMCAVLTGIKFMEDYRISNHFWSKVGGVELDELNKMEIEFCKLFQWRLFISKDEYDRQQARFSDPLF